MNQYQTLSILFISVFFSNSCDFSNIPLSDNSSTIIKTQVYDIHHKTDPSLENDRTLLEDNTSSKCGIDEKEAVLDNQLIPKKIPADIEIPKFANISESVDHEIDVLFLYSAEAREAAASENGCRKSDATCIETRISEEVAYTNSAFSNSEVDNVKVNVVHVMEVDVSDLESLANKGSYLDWLDSKFQDPDTSFSKLRLTYQADVISLWIKDIDGCAGAAHGMYSISSSFATRAFHFVNQSGLGVFAHELGHNMGLMHDWYVQKNTNPQLYAHGYSLIEYKVRTIMAYTDECNDLGFGCQKIPYYSNPDVLYSPIFAHTKGISFTKLMSLPEINLQPLPLGSESADTPANNANVLRESIPYVAAFSDYMVWYSNIISNL